jgi:hypothetical protein
MTTVLPDIIIRMPDIRRALMCGRGVQGWFRLRNLDYDKFITEGYAIETLEAIDCDMARQVCAAARLHYQQE